MNAEESFDDFVDRKLTESYLREMDEATNAPWAGQTDEEYAADTERFMVRLKVEREAPTCCLCSEPIGIEHSCQIVACVYAAGKSPCGACGRELISVPPAHGPGLGDVVAE